MTGGRKTWLIAVAAVGALAICAAAALGPGTFDERVGLATRLTARWSACWFLAAFVAGPLSRIYGGVWSAVARQRRYLGLGFAAAHTVHFVCLIIALTMTPTTRPLLTLVGGGTAYAVMFAMAATSSDAAMRALGKNWKRLHTIGIWVIWFVFLQSYAGRIFKPGTEVLGMVMTTPFVCAALLRVPAVRRLLSPKRSAA